MESTLSILTEPWVLWLEVRLVSIENFRWKEVVGNLNLFWNDLAGTINQAWTPVLPALSWLVLVLSIVWWGFWAVELLLLLLLSSIVLLLLLQVVIVHLFLHFDVFLVYSINLLSQVLVLSFESFNQFILFLDFTYLFLVHIILDFHLVPQIDELLCLWYNLNEILICVACWFALIIFEWAWLESSWRNEFHVNSWIWFSFSLGSFNTDNLCN